jgi:hypothetical protein
MLKHGCSTTDAPVVEADERCLKRSGELLRNAIHLAADDASRGDPEPDVDGLAACLISLYRNDERSQSDIIAELRKALAEAHSGLTKR